VVGRVFSPALLFFFKEGFELRFARRQKRPDEMAITNRNSSTVGVGRAREKSPKQGFGKIVCLMSRKKDCSGLLGFCFKKGMPLIARGLFP
jgi:hypothetical protein